jgi:hypothetical protein
MSVAFDAKGTAPADQDAVTTLDCTALTVGAGSNRVLIATLIFSSTAPTGVTVTWDPSGTNQSLTQLATFNTATNDQRVELWGLIAPTSGNKTLRAAWTGSSELILDGISFTGADQTGGATTFPNTTTTRSSGGSANPSVVVTSAANNMTVVVVGTQTQFPSAATQTVIFLLSGAGPANGGASYAAGAATVTHGFTQANADWVAVGVDIAAAAGGALPFITHVGGQWI